MNCPRCQIPLSRHDYWCSKCNTYYNQNASANSNVGNAAPAASPAAQTPYPQAPWSDGSGAAQQTTYYAPNYAPPPPQSGGSGRGRFAIGGVGIGTIAILLRGLNLIYHTQQNYADNAAQNARGTQNFQQSAGQSQTSGDGGISGFAQAHEDSRAAMRNQQQQSLQQQQMMQAQIQAQRRLQVEAVRQMQAQQASLRSMNAPMTAGPAPMTQPGFSPMGPMGGGARFGRP